MRLIVDDLTVSLIAERKRITRISCVTLQIDVRWSVDDFRI